MPTTNPLLRRSRDRATRSVPRVLSLSLLLVLACAPLGAEAAPKASAAAVPSGLRRVVVLHTNDVHGQLFPTEPPEDLGGAARRATLVARERARAEAEGRGFLLVDAGDINTGTRESDEARGLLDAKVMKALGYHAAALGNHEFDLLPDQQRAFRDALGFPLLSANVRKPGGDRLLPAWTLVETGGVRVALVGLTTADTPQTSTFGRDYPVHFASAGDEFERSLAEIGKRADAVVVLSHLGEVEDGELHARFKGRFAAWLGGHTHTPRITPVPGRAIYMRTGSKGRWIGRLELWFDGKSAWAVQPSLIALDASVPEDPAMAALLPSRQAGRQVAVADSAIEKAGPQGPFASTALGNFASDALRDQGGTDIAIVNRGGLRRALPAGPVTENHLYEICPFKNRLYVYSLDAAELTALFEDVARIGPGEPGFVDVSGIEVRLAGRRVESLRIAGKPLVPGRRYTLAVSDFLARGGDGFQAFARFPAPRVIDVPPAEMLIAYAASRRELRPDYTPRIVAKEDASAP